MCNCIEEAKKMRDEYRKIKFTDNEWISWTIAVNVMDKFIERLESLQSETKDDGYNQWCIDTLETYSAYINPIQAMKIMLNVLYSKLPHKK